jgi:Ca2+-binding EF-hand superfamily protein
LDLSESEDDGDSDDDNADDADEDAEDEFGFLLSEGGFAEFYAGAAKVQRQYNRYRSASKSHLKRALKNKGRESKGSKSDLMLRLLQASEMGGEDEELTEEELLEIERENAEKEAALEHLRNVKPEFAKMKAPELREELAKRGKSTDGKKAHLVERLARSLEELGNCMECRQSLHKYNVMHPCYATLGVIDEWHCDVCGQAFNENEPLYCCDTFNDCDWGACSDCQGLVREALMSDEEKAAAARLEAAVAAAAEAEAKAEAATQADLAKMRALFDEIDSDQSGELDTDEVKILFERLNIKLSKRKLAKAFRAMDMDDSGDVSWDEYRSWYEGLSDEERDDLREQAERAKAAEEKRAKELKRMHAIFDELDEVGKGELETDQIKSLFLKLGMNLSKKKIVKAFSAMDADASGVITWDEFQAWYIGLTRRERRELYPPPEAGSVAEAEAEDAEDGRAIDDEDDADKDGDPDSDTDSQGLSATQIPEQTTDTHVVSFEVEDSPRAKKKRTRRFKKPGKKVPKERVQGKFSRLAFPSRQHLRTCMSHIHDAKLLTSCTVYAVWTRGALHFK